jgi:transcriptional regulator with XRE-family HTH domain
MKINDRLRAARECLGLKQQEFAIKSGVSYSVYQKYELGSSKPGSDALEGFVRLGISSDWLLTGEGEMLLSDNQARPALSDKPNESKDEERLQGGQRIAELEVQEHVLDLPILRTAITLTEEVATVQALSVDQRAELILNFYTRLSRQPVK